MNPEKPIPVSQGNTRLVQMAWTVFAFVLCTRAWLIKVWATPVPAWDEWNATALGLLKPWLAGSLRWADLFAAHNEHRIVLTRLADLAIFCLDGRWNPWWQLLLSAALHAATAVALLCFFWRFLGPATQAIMAVSLAFLFSLPNDWQNALWSFQSQFYFSGLLTVLALGGLLLGQPYRKSWLLGCLAALLALFSVGSGILASATACIVAGLTLLAGQATRRQSISRHSIIPVLALLAIVLAGAMLRVEVPDHAQLCARTFSQFCAVFFRCLSWPWIDSPWVWLALQAPILGMTARLIRQRRPPDHEEQLLLGLSLLVLLHSAAVAYSRGNSLPEARPLSRYQDPMLLSTATNLYVMLRFSARHAIVRGATLIWLGLLFAGIIPLLTTNLSLHLPYTRAQGVARLAQVRSYLVTHDPNILRPANEAHLLHPDPALVQRALDDPILGKAWPREFTDPSAHPPWLITYSPWLTLVSLFSLLLVAAQRARSNH